ncbi:MAG: DUF4288 domain-containing protein [Pseudonocardia sp.]
MSSSEAPGRQPYITVLLFGSTADSDDYRSLYREDVTLLYGVSQDDAQRRAEEHGRSLETTFANDRGERITWTLLEVVDVAPVLEDRFDEDAELYSRHFRDVDAYRSFDPRLRGEKL